VQQVIIQARMRNISNSESSVKTIVSWILLEIHFQNIHFLGEVHFKVKMTTSMGKLKKSYAERQGKKLIA
jgi:hypothetical protein